MSRNSIILETITDSFIKLYSKLGNRRKDINAPYFEHWVLTDISTPKYAWQWNFTIDEYEQIKTLVKENAACLRELAENNSTCCKLIQLYVSEWYKREYNGNSGAGNPLKSIKANITARDICSTIGKEIYTSQSTSAVPQPEYLSTLYVDGGLPLNYLLIKPSSLKASIIRIIDGDSFDLAELCHNQVINQSYNDHFARDYSDASIYDFVHDVIINEVIDIEGFEEFERIIKETKLQRFHPKFNFECMMYQKEDIWYRTLNLKLKPGSSIETKNYFDYSRVKSWHPELDDCTESSWIDFYIYTKTNPDQPAMFLKAANNFNGQFFIPDNGYDDTIILEGDDDIARILIRYDGIDGLFELPKKEYSNDDLSRIQLDEAQPGVWSRHTEWSGFRSAVFFFDSMSDSDVDSEDENEEIEGGYEIEDSINHDEEIEVFRGLTIHKVDVFGTLKFTDGRIFHASAKFSIEPTNNFCRSICFPPNNLFKLKTDNEEKDVLLLILNNSRPEEGFKLFFFGEEVADFNVEGFDSTKHTPYRTSLFATNLDQSFPLGEAVIIPDPPKTMLLGKEFNHEIVVNCFTGDQDRIELPNTSADLYEYDLTLPDGSVIVLPLYPPYKSFDILRRKPKTLLNSFNYSKKEDRFVDIITKPVSDNKDLLFFSRPTKSDSIFYYVRKRKRRGDPERFQFRRCFLRRSITKTGPADHFRFLVDPEFVIASSVKIHDELPCELDLRTGYYKLSETALKALKGGLNSSLKITQKSDNGDIHLQRFEVKLITNNELSITQIK